MPTLARHPLPLVATPLFAAHALLASCGKAPAPATTAGAAAPGAPLPKVRFQTDWYPQAEHGGHYQAVARGFYREAGIDVEILPGGPNSAGPQKILSGLAEIAMGRSDEIIVNASDGLPFIIVGALMQHDPQALLLHDENPVKSFADLNGRSVMAVPGSTWVTYLKARYKIDFNLIPLNYGLAQFMGNKGFIQQCFVTNEPFFVAQNGAKPRTLLLDDSGFKPYRVYFCSQKYARENPAAVRAFVAASIRGWDDFIGGDSAPGKKLIAALNEQMTVAFMDYSIRAMTEAKLVGGDPAKGEETGLITRKRLQEQVDILVELKIIPAALPLAKYASFDFLPPALRAKVD
ncbi:MAG: ABC transporter substrate-binding protein [Undibacterium sp.]|nr:ABC transporter substrate-binding protein [Opitutaceae bacterium]